VFSSSIPVPCENAYKKFGVNMKITLKFKNLVLVVEISERPIIMFIGLIFGFKNVFPYV